MKGEKESTYDIIIDKGTLDAIASDKANAQTNKLKNEVKHSSLDSRERMEMITLVTLLDG